MVNELRLYAYYLSEELRKMNSTYGEVYYSLRTFYENGIINNKIYKQTKRINKIFWLQHQRCLIIKFAANYNMNLKLKTFDEFNLCKIRQKKIKSILNE
jgi:hypothetical protein